MIAASEIEFTQISRFYLFESYSRLRYLFVVGQPLPFDAIFSPLKLIVKRNASELGFGVKSDGHSTQPCG